MAHTSLTVVSNTNTTGETLPLKLDASYKGDEVKRTVAQVLNLNSVKGWSVVDFDSKRQLALAHYDNDVDMDEFGDIHGVLVDTAAQCVVASSFGYTPLAVANEIVEANEMVKITDVNGQAHVFPKASTTITRLFEGVVMRAIWHAGELHLVTHRRIDASRSRWGRSPSFVQMYHEAGGPTAEQLFDTTKPYSSTCYVFMVVHPALLVGTRQSVTTPYIVHLSTNELPVTFPPEQVARGVPTFECSRELTGAVEQPFVHGPLSLTIEEANYHLKYGFYNEYEVEDVRLRTGEAIIMWNVENGEITDLVKVHSEAYQWRTVMRGDNNNIRNQFYSLLGIAYPPVTTEEDWRQLCSKLIPFPSYSQEALMDRFVSSGAILNLPLGKVSKEDYSTRESRIYLLWMNFVLSLPPGCQEEALNVYLDFNNDRQEVIQWIRRLENEHRNIQEANLPKRVKDIILLARANARKCVSSGNNYSQKGKVLTLPTLIRNNIRNYVMKERGPSLYGLVRDMKRPPEDEETHEESLIALEDEPVLEAIIPEDDETQEESLITIDTDEVYDVPEPAPVVSQPLPLTTGIPVQMVTAKILRPVDPQPIQPLE